MDDPTKFIIETFITERIPATKDQYNRDRITFQEIEEILDHLEPAPPENERGEGYSQGWAWCVSMIASIHQAILVQEQP